MNGPDAADAWERLWRPAPVPARLDGGRDVFGPRPEDLTPLVEDARARYGPGSFEYAHELLGLGDALMVQCRRAEASAAYAEALSIYRAAGEDGWLTAWAWAKLATAKQSFQDLPGAEAALSEAVALWDRLEASAFPAVPDPEKIRRIITRYREDLESLRRVIAFQNRRPPALPEDDE